jgi:hypothetical protein
MVAEAQVLRKLRGPRIIANSKRADFSRTTWQKIVTFINGHLPRNSKFRENPLMRLKFFLFGNQRAELAVNQTGCK